jgi:serine beta-lactamase-like protein LACTB
MFASDELEHEPGSKYLYTTLGYTLLSAVIEGAAKQPFDDQLKQLLNTLGMYSTCLDKNSIIIPHRARYLILFTLFLFIFRYYHRDKHHRLLNVPEVDNSYKWAGGGILSNVIDLLTFANSILYS